ncbi:MAG: FprA family A-type flavoprotein [Bacteroidales bacterium]|jgi:flavorubredoxin|nr:FprA family A-type flavoprotein [Bacteroidales bacterium]
MNTSISKTIQYVGVDDLDIDLFENQYIVPEGMAYNSYLITAGKTVLMDTVDARKSAEWEANVTKALDGRKLDYLVVLHVEPDHSANIVNILTKYPECQCICSERAVPLLNQFFPTFDFSSRITTKKDGETLEFGSHKLTFFTAAMVHWPEVLVAYESMEKVFFSADAFGKFGALQNETDDWACEARRYYFNIVGKYGVQVQSLLKKVAGLDIQTICALHGPILKENLSYYINLYDTWSSYRAETEGVFVAHSSLHGNTSKAALALVDMLRAEGLKVAESDICRADLAEVIEDAFRYDRIVFAAPTYDGGLMPIMETLLAHLKAKGYRNKRVGLIENGSWAPQSARLMRAALETMKDITIVEPVVTLRSTMKESDKEALAALANALK